MSNPAIDLDSLTPDEQLELLERLWDRLSLSPERISVTEAQRRELDIRLDDLDGDVQAAAVLGIPWGEVLKQIQSR